jgi:hypothetical protein
MKVLVTLTSQLTGVMHTRDLNVDAIELYAYMTGEDLRPVQVVFPHLSVEDREFLITGITAEEWNALLGEEPDTLH